jgi:hypothetical protein
MSFLHSPYSGCVLVTVLGFTFGAVAYFWPSKQPLR